MFNVRSARPNASRVYVIPTRLYIFYILIHAQWTAMLGCSSKPSIYNGLRLGVGPRLQRTKTLLRVRTSCTPVPYVQLSAELHYESGKN